ncbi:MAG TPA: hypothetical protein VEF76_09875 [Patescibacteria group bacterium]|nr:hypothetical protein [Patescibacteria group bacterium]
MAQAQTAEAQARPDPNKMPLPPDGVFRKIENALHWFNEPSEGKYTIGAALRKMTFREPSEHGLHLSRIGRLTERVCTIGFALAACAMGPANVGFFLLLVGAKVYGAGIGAAVMVVAKGAEGTARKLDHIFNKPKMNPEDLAPKRKLVGASEQNDGPTGARNAHEIAQDEKIGASRIVDPNATIKPQFDQVAAKAFDPKGPKPLEAYGLGGAAKKAANGMKNGA